MGCGDCGRVLLSSTRRNRNCCEEHTGDSDPHEQYLLESEYTAASVLERLLTVDGIGSGLDSDLLDGLNSTAFSLDGHTHPSGAHTHAGEDIVSGLVADLRIASTIARDSEVMTIVLANDGSGSGLDADLLDGLSSAAFALASHTHAGEDITSGTIADARIASTITRDSEVFTIVLSSDGTGSGLDADLLDGLNSTAFALASHVHAGEDITSGTVSDARIASTITRDSEVFTIVLSADGTGSGLDADLLDGLNSTAFALVSHVHAGEDITSGTIADVRIASTITRDSEVFTIVLAADGIGSGLNADLLDDLNSSAFALSSHVHAGEDITSGTVADARIASTITRDSEVFGIVLANDGAGSGLDADLLDGLSSAAFALVSHTHAGEDIVSGTVADARIASTITRDSEVFTIVLAADGTGSGLDADLLDGVQGAGYALVSHVHAGEDITSGTVADARIASTITRDSEVFSIVLANDGSGSGLDADLLDGLSSLAFVKEDGTVTGATGQAQVFAKGTNVTGGVFDAPTTVNVLARFTNSEDVPAQIWLRSGLTADARMYLGWLDYTGATKWVMGRDIFNAFIQYDYAGAAHRTYQVPNGESHYDAAGTSAVVINGHGDAGCGTGGLIVKSGGAAPTTYGSITSTGMLLNGGIRPGANSTTAFQVQNAAGNPYIIGDSSDQRLGVGVIPQAKLHVGADGYFENLFECAGASSFHRADVSFVRARGTLFGTRTIVQLDDYVGLFQWRGFDGNDSVSVVAQFGAFIDGVPGSNDMPGRLVFATTPDGSDVALNRLIIKNTGRIAVGDHVPDGQLDIQQASTTAAIPTLELEQADLSEEFINFVATAGAGNPIDTAALGAYYGKVRVAVNGTFKFLALYDV